MFDSGIVDLILSVDHYFGKQSRKNEPINMEGYIFDIKRFAIHDGPGIRTTLFMTGCPLDCLWCHNPESRPDSGVLPGKSRKISVENAIEELKKDSVFYEESGGGVTFSGGEPLGGCLKILLTFHSYDNIFMFD